MVSKAGRWVDEHMAVLRTTSREQQLAGGTLPLMTAGAIQQTLQPAEDDQLHISTSCARRPPSHLPMKGIPSPVTGR